MRDSGAEDCLVADYYQSVHVIIILSEALWRLLWEAFETWASEKDTTQRQQPIEAVLRTLLDNTNSLTEQLESIKTCHTQLGVLQDQMVEFQKTAIFGLNFGWQSLPIYLCEMKKLPETAPDVHSALMNGAFVGRRSDGHHNGVCPDMLLEQTYNAYYILNQRTARASRLQVIFGSF